MGVLPSVLHRAVLGLFGLTEELADFKSRSVVRRVALQAVFIGLVAQDYTDLPPKPEPILRAFGLTSVGLARW